MIKSKLNLVDKSPTSIYLSGCIQFSLCTPAKYNTVNSIGEWYGCRGFIYEALLQYYKGQEYSCRDRPNIKINLLFLKNTKFFPILIKLNNLTKKETFLDFMHCLAKYEKEHGWLPNKTIETNVNSVYYVTLSKNYILSHFWLSMLLLAIRELNETRYTSFESYMSGLYRLTGVYTGSLDASKLNINLINFIYDNVGILSKVINKNVINKLETKDIHDLGFGNVLRGYIEVMGQSKGLATNPYKVKTKIGVDKTRNILTPLAKSMAANMVNL